MLQTAASQRKKEFKGVWSLKPYIPSDNSHLSNHEVCWTDSARIQNLERWQKGGDNHHNHLKQQKCNPKFFS